MKESDWRKWHRNLGIVVALFFAIQVASGLLLSLEGLSASPGHAGPQGIQGPQGGQPEEGEYSWDEVVGFVHHEGGFVGALYRIALGVGMLWMAASGTMIYLKIRARSSKRT